MLHKKTKILGSHLLKATNLVSQPRFKPEFEPEAHMCPFSHLIALHLISCIHKPDKFNRSCTDNNKSFFLNFTLSYVAHSSQVNTLFPSYKVREY